MISLFIIAIMAVGLSAAAGYGVFSIIAAANTMADVSRNLTRMEMIADLVRNEMRAVNLDGIPYVPVGQTVTWGATSYTGLPGAVGVNRVTPWGAPYAYCPYAEGAGAGTTVTMGDGTTSYAVTATSGYVTAGSHATIPSAAALRALVIAPDPDTATMPLCSDVAYDAATGTFSVTGGMVVAVTASQIAAQDLGQQARRALRFADGATDAGDTGLTSASAMALGDALSLWAATMPRTFEITVVGSASLDAVQANLATGFAGTPDMTLVLTGVGNPTITLSGPLVLPVRTVIRGMTIAGDAVQSLNADLTIEDATVFRIVGRNGDLSLLGTVGITRPSSEGVLWTGGDVYVGRNAAGAGATSIATTGNAIVINGPGGAVVDDVTLTATAADTAFVFDAYPRVTTAGAGLVDVTAVTDCVFPDVLTELQAIDPAPIAAESDATTPAPSHVTEHETYATALSSLAPTLNCN